MEKISNGERVGSLSTANNFHGRKLEMNRPSISLLKNSHFHEEFSSSGQEKAPEELELFHAKKAVKDLVVKIEQSNARVKAQKLELQSLRNSTNGGEDPEHEELAQNLDDLKRELSKLKIDVSLASESKARASKDIEVYNQKTSSSLKRSEELRKEIEEASEEHVLVELARIEAEKELREIESQRAAEAMEFSNKMEAAMKRICELRREISGAKELEEKLAAINTDVSVLQNEMELIRTMDKNFPAKISATDGNKSSDMEQLKIVENELRKAKKEQESIKEEGFQFMASMDLVRVELLQISKETNGMKKLEKNTESNIERLNSKLLKARSKLESDTSAEERTRGIVFNLSTALQQLRTEVETSDIKVEIERTERDIKSTQNKLMDNLSELERVKASEAAALVNLKSLAERMLNFRAIASQNSPTICVSKWEYEYLSKKAGLAMEVAEKKIAAINAWIGTLKAQEKEMLLKSELIEKEIKAMRFTEEVCGMEKVMAARITVGDEANEFMEMLKAGMSSPRKLNSEDSLTAIASRRRSKTRRVSGVQGMKSGARSPSLAIKKRMREAPSLAKLLRRRNGWLKQKEVDFDSYASFLLAPENDHSQQ